MQVEKIIVGPIETNCYFVHNGAETIIIDPGAEPENISKYCARRKLKPVAIINTHGHYDHILANMPLKRQYQIPIYYPQADHYLIHLQQRLYAVGDMEIDFEYTDTIEIPGFSCKVLPTPGHTKGGSCILFGDRLLSGDTLFAEGYLGRTDLWGGSDEDMRESLQKLLKLEDAIIVYPGHGPSSTIGQERKNHAR
jgi:glyoxylase-like metal-dependent hydrolase (beta-lactamase superfamily II)